MTRFPAEWEPQAAVLIAWPHHTCDFGDRMESVEQSYRCIAETISRRQRLLIVCRDHKHQRHIQALLADGLSIEFILAPVNDIWVRDTAFLTVARDGAGVLLNFKFNGWGGKYPHDDDDALNQRLLAHTFFQGQNHADVDFILEGGSIESDGQGTLMTTRQCLLHPNRNKGLSQQQIERVLQQQFGANRVLWVEQPHLPGDDTDAHIDTLARFCPANTIAYTRCDDPLNPLYASLNNMEAQLQALRTPAELPYNLIALPLPKAIFAEDGRPLPANYANFLIINDAVLVPVYGDDNDDVAVHRLAACFPGRDIIATPCRPLLHQYGSLHCMTMQFPSH